MLDQQNRNEATPEPGKVDIREAVKRWAEGGGTGASAKAIAAHLAGYGEETGDYPMDEGDFLRCEKLLDEVPGLRAMLGQMAEVNAYWAALVPQWGSIREASDRTNAIRAVIRPIEREDPSHARLGDGVSMRVGNPIFQGGDTSPRMKETDADREVRDGAFRVTAAALRQFVERFERLEAEKKDIADQQKEVMAEAKARGYDVKILRKVIALRKRDRADVAEEEAVLQLYRDALGV